MTDGGTSTKTRNTEDKGCKGCEDANCKGKDDKFWFGMLSLRCLYNVSTRMYDMQSSD